MYGTRHISTATYSTGGADPPVYLFPIPFFFHIFPSILSLIFRSPHPIPPTTILEHVAAVVDLADVDELLAAADSELLGVLLARQRLHARLDRVHRVPRPRHLGRDVLDPHRPEDLEEPVRGAQAKTYNNVFWLATLLRSLVFWWGFFSFSFSLSTGSGVGGCSKEGIFVRCSCVVVWLRMTRWCVKEQRFQELDESWM